MVRPFLLDIALNKNAMKQRRLCFAIVLNLVNEQKRKPVPKSVGDMGIVIEKFICPHEHFFVAKKPCSEVDLQAVIID